MIASDKTIVIYIGCFHFHKIFAGTNHNIITYDGFVGFTKIDSLCLTNLLKLL